MKRNIVFVVVSLLAGLVAAIPAVSLASEKSYASEISTEKIEVHGESERRTDHSDRVRERRTKMWLEQGYLPGARAHARF